MILFMIGTRTGKMTMEHWLVINEDGGVMYEILEDTMNADVPVRIRGPLSEHSLANEECGNYEVHRALIAHRLTSNDFQLVVRPIYF